MGRRKPFSGASCRSSPELSELPVDVLALILGHLPLAERVELAPVSKAWSEAVRLNTRGMAVDLRRKTREAAGASRRLFPSVGTVALVSPAAASAAGSAAAAATLATAWEPEETRLWRPAPKGWRPAAAAWHLRRAAAVAGGAGAVSSGSGGRGRSLALVLAAPDMDASASEVHRMLSTAGMEGQICAVAAPQGLLRLDGALNRVLTWTNAPAAGLPAALQVRPWPALPFIAAVRMCHALVSAQSPHSRLPAGTSPSHHRAPFPPFLPVPPQQASAPYARLERLALKLCPSDDLQAVLGSIRPAALPALRCLALLAPTGAGMAADMGALCHAGLARLDLRGLQLPAGFASLQQLTGEPTCMSVGMPEA